MPEQCVNCKKNLLQKLAVHNRYTLYECGDCAIQFWWPFQNPGNLYYEGDQIFIKRNKDPESHPLFPSQKYFLKRSTSTGSKLLDIGMGTGRFLNAARARGYEVWGLDFDKDAVEVARTFYGLTNVFDCDAKDFLKRYPDKKYDVITLFEVIEHLDNFDLVDLIPKFLNPGGILVLSTPFRETWEPFTVNDLPPRHLTRWNVLAVENFFRRHGYETRIKKMSIPFHRYMMRWNEWTRGWLSFGTTKKILGHNGSKKISEKKKGATTRVVTTLSLIKLYVLFFIPAVILYIYLWLRGGQNYTRLYIVAWPKIQH